MYLILYYVCFVKYVKVRLFDVRVKRPLVFKFTGHTDAVGALLLDSDKACVVSGSKDGTVRAFDLRTGKNRLEVKDTHAETSSFTHTCVHYIFCIYVEHVFNEHPPLVSLFNTR